LSNKFGNSSVFFTQYIVTDEQLEEIEDKVLDDIFTLEERIQHLEETTRPISPDKGLGRLTRLDAMQDKSVKEAALRQSVETLSKAKYALSQLYRKGFGKCGICEKEIPFERLLAVPHATICVSCAEE
jgi:DnaK suppressor protein